MGRRVEQPERSEPPASSPSVPSPLTAMIGRADELTAVSDALRRSRLVTLTGPGGVGKTRMAVELGRRQSRRRADGVWVVDLAAVAVPDDVATETARVLGVRGATGVAKTDVLRRFVADRDVLLVLDNCEHVVDACAELGMALLGACSNLRILATSREPLGIAGETVWRLEPLRPEHAYRLFLERARERRPDLVPDRDAETAILDICSRLDHLPLGIELAAARLSIMSPEEIVASLDAHLGELGRRRPTQAHHRSVRAAVEWSYHLLDPVEQAAFRSLAVFVGGFDADAARAVAPGMSLDVLARLVDKSLVEVVHARQDRTRYRLLETVRDHAAEQLAAADEVDAARARHLQHFSTIGIPPEDGWMSARVLALLEERGPDYGNVRAAVERAADVDPCAAMHLLVQTRDLFFVLGQADGSRLAELVLRRCPERNRDRAEATIVAGQFAFLLGDVATAIRLTAEAAEMGVELRERAVEGTAHLFLGLQQMFGGIPEEARGHLSTARAILQETGDLRGEARATAALGLISMMGHDPATARELLDAALAIGRAAGDRWSQGQANLYLGIVAESTADRQAASSFFREAVQCMRPFRESSLLPVALAGQAGVLAARDPATALQVAAAAWAARGRDGGEFPPFFRALAQRGRDAAVRAVGDDADRLWEVGSRLSSDDAIALAFGTPRPRTPHALGISNREIDVVKLVADGLSNKEIAARLHLSVRTVESHVRNLLTKTGLHNRTQLATWARERHR